MEVHAAIGDGRTVRRIIALLIGFAMLAERAADRSIPVRLLVLWLLRRAETVVGEFAFKAAGMPPASVEGLAPDGTGPDDALALAARLRALATMLGALLRTACRRGRRPSSRGSASMRVAPGRARLQNRGTRRPDDTS